MLVGIRKEMRGVLNGNDKPEQKLKAMLSNHRRMAHIARAALAGKPIWQTLAPQNPVEVKAALHEYYRGRADEMLAGKTPKDDADHLKKIRSSLPWEKAEAMDKQAQGDVKGELIDDMKAGLLAGDADAAKRNAKVRLGLGYGSSRPARQSGDLYDSTVKWIDGRADLDDAQKAQLRKDANKAIFGK